MTNVYIICRETDDWGDTYQEIVAVYSSKETAEKALELLRQEGHCHDIAEAPLDDLGHVAPSLVVGMGRSGHVSMVRQEYFQPDGYIGFQGCASPTLLWGTKTPDEQIAIAAANAGRLRIIEAGCWDDELRARRVFEEEE